MPRPSHCGAASSGDDARPERRPLDASARAFLDHLGLPLEHPLCRDVDGGRSGEAPTPTQKARHNGGEEDGAAAAGAPPSSFAPPEEPPRPFVFELPNATVATILGGSSLPPPPGIGPISLLELHDRSFYELALTASTMSAPTLAMAELWLRFFAVFLSPLCVAWSIRRELTTIATTKESRGVVAVDGTAIAICTMGMASSAVLFTDSLYVYEYGRRFGLSLFVASLVAAARCAASMGETTADDGGVGGGGKMRRRRPVLHKKTLFQCVISVFIIATTFVYLRSDGGHALESALRQHLPPSLVPAAADANADSHNPLEHLPDPGIDLPTIEPGLYHSASNRLASSIVSHWPESGRMYDVERGATPYLLNGDQRTGIPFLVNKVEEQEYVRVWTRNGFDGEHLALDIAFPYSKDAEDAEEGGDDVGDDCGRRRAGAVSFAHDASRPVYLVLHGLNGGSHEEYVKDLVERRRAEGSTVVVLIARGMMDTEMVGWNAFHGARTGDVDAAARAIGRGLDSLAEANGRPQRQVLAGVGYSMGAIILSNYVARSGTHCALDAAMAVSGGLDMRQQLNFKRSMRLWQPMLTFNLREDILIGKYARHYRSRLSEDQFLQLLRVTSISALDVEAIVTYNSFDSLVHYYSEMSAMGDREPEFQLFGRSSDADSARGETSWGRIANVSVPFAVLQALDDPLVGWRTVGTDNPQDLADSGSGNVMLLLTKAGGHVGWPLGNNPKKHGWKWMSDTVRDFVVAVDMAKQEMVK